MQNPTTTTIHSFQQLNTFPLGEAAVAYACRGIPVFPLQPNSRRTLPHCSWKEMATTNLETIRDWWGLLPDANIGLVMGSVSGLMAMEFSAEDGQDGRRTYKAISQEPFLGPIQQAPGGGQCFIFKHTPGLKNLTHKGNVGGVQGVITEGSYIIAAPSIIPDGAYQWIQG